MDGTKRTGKPGPKRWLGIGVRLLATLLLLLLLLALNRCSFADPSVDHPAVIAPAAKVAGDQLGVDPRPAAAKAVVDRSCAEIMPLFTTQLADSESGSE
jgi:hypothetical protein